MSKPKFKVTKGLAFVITTGEPVFVTEIADGVATLTRGITGETGIRYETDSLPLEQLETRHEQIKRNMDYAEYAEELRMDMEEHLLAVQLANSKSQAANPLPNLLQLSKKSDA